MNTRYYAASAPLCSPTIDTSQYIDLPSIALVYIDRIGQFEIKIFHHNLPICNLLVTVIALALKRFQFARTSVERCNSGLTVSWEVIKLVQLLFTIVRTTKKLVRFLPNHLIISFSSEVLFRLRFPSCTGTGIRGIIEISCELRHQFLPSQDFYTFS